MISLNQLSTLLHGSVGLKNNFYNKVRLNISIEIEVQK